MRIYGIDPGASGGVVWQDFALGGALSISPVSTGSLAGMSETDITNMIPPNTGGDVAYVEDIPKFMGTLIPGSSIAVLFLSYGIIRGVLAARGIRTILVKPQDWQAHFRLGTRKATGTHGQWKNKLKAEAQRRFPQLGKAVTLKTADALLILDYAISQQNGSNAKS